MKHPLTASERRGAILLAMIALLVVASSFLVDRCSSRADAGIAVPEAEVLVRGDTLGLRESEGKAPAKKRKGKNSGKSKEKKSKEKKSYGRRSPLDEPV